MANGALLLVALLLVPGATAHAEIASSEPPGGARLAIAPELVRLTLTQPVEPSNVELRVTDHDGRRVDDGDVQFIGGDRPVISVGLRPGLGDGAYLITLTATSLTDSHRVTYTRGFAVGGFEPPASSSGDRIDPEAVAARAVAYAGLALTIGGVLLGWRLGWPAALVTPVRVGAALHAAAAVALLALARAEADQGWSVFAATPVGTVYATRTVLSVLLLALVMAAPPRNRMRGAAAGVTLLLVAIATARFTHASGHGAWAIGNDVIHIVAAGAWVGGLAVLLWLWRQPRDILEDARAFSGLALASVIALAATGVVAALLIIPAAQRDLDGLRGSSYASYLAGKVVLAIAMVCLAAVNRFLLVSHRPAAWLAALAARQPVAWLRPAGADGARPAAGVRRLVAGEAGLGAIVIVLAALLLSSSPPSAPPEEEGLRLVGSGDDMLVTALLSPEPVAGGSSALRFYVQYSPDHPDAPGEPVRDDTCGRAGCIVVHVEGAGVNDVHTAQPEGDGWWTVESLVWPQDGDHLLRVDIQTEFVFRDTVELAFHVAAA